jgi:hypothetical protein
MPQWNPRKQLLELPVLGGDSASDLRNFSGQSHAQWLVAVVVAVVVGTSHRR